MNEDVTILLKAIEAGDAEASSRLMTKVYSELKRIAQGKMSQESPGQTLQPTALVHEAWMGMVDDKGRVLFKDRAHFFGAASEAMRRVLIDRARARQAQKRGGEMERVNIDFCDISVPTADDELLAVHEALEKFEKVDARKAQLVKLRYFSGLAFEEVATLLEISVPTAHRDWAYSRAWLSVEIGKAV